MNQVTEIIKIRRSVRSFQKDKAINPADLDIILRMAMQAPSAKNEQIWEFLVIDDRKVLDSLALNHPYRKILEETPLAILVAANLDRVKSTLYLQDLGALTQNILLTSTSLGLGSCWLGIGQNDERASYIINFFNLPKNIIPYSLIAIGYPTYQDALRFIDRFEPKYIRYNRW